MKMVLITNGARASVALSYTDSDGNAIGVLGANAFVQPVPQTDGPDIHLASASVSSDQSSVDIIAGDTFTGITTVTVSASDSQGNDLQPLTFGIHVVQSGFTVPGFVHGDND